MSRIGGIKGVGFLGIYDICLRIAYLEWVQNLSDRLMPRDYVYLSCGALAGFLVVYKKSDLNKVGLELRPSCWRVPIEFFKPDFVDSSENPPKVLKAWEIEDILCVELNPKKNNCGSGSPNIGVKP